MVSSYLWAHYWRSLSFRTTYTRSESDTGMFPDGYTYLLGAMSRPFNELPWILPLHQDIGTRYDGMNVHKGWVDLRILGVRTKVSCGTVIDNGRIDLYYLYTIYKFEHNSKSYKDIKDIWKEITPFIKKFFLRKLCLKYRTSGLYRFIQYMRLGGDP